MTTAVTYRTSERARDLRTVYVAGLREASVLVPGGRVDVLLGKLTHGSTCAHAFWADALGTSGDDFVLPADQVVAVRPVPVTGKPKLTGVFGPDGQIQLKQACK